MSDWYAIVVDGGEAATRGFVSGFLGDRGLDATAVLVAEDVGVAAESLGERLLDLLNLGRHHVVLVTAAHADAFAEALARGGRGAGLALAERHRVAGASFAFTVETFSRDVAQDVHATLASPPPGVTIVDRDESAETHGDEKGLTFFAPGHAYAYRARGRATGGLDGVLALRRRLGEIEAVALEPVHLETADERAGG